MWYLAPASKSSSVLGIGEVIPWYLHLKGKFYIIVINVLKKKNSSMCHLNKFKDMFRT